MKKIGLDIGGTKMEVMLTGEYILDVVQRETVPTIQQHGYDFFVKQVVELIQKYLCLAGEACSIGIGIPGSISNKTQLVINSNIICINNKNFKSDLELALNQPVSIANDVNCMTLSEALYGAGKNEKCVLGAGIGTGFGGGLVINQKNHLGSQGYAAEWGHMCLVYDGAECWCGQKGCTEQYISGTGYERLYFEQTKISKKVPEIHQDWLKNCPIAVEVTHRYLNYFAQGIANLIYSIDPDIIVLGGGVSQLPIFYNEGVQKIKKHINEDDFQVNIVPTQLGHSSGIYGAALLSTRQD